MKQFFTILALILVVCLFNESARALPHPKPISVQQQAAAETLLRTAYSLYREGKYDEALSKCTESVTLNPNDYRARALRGYIYIAQKKWKDASDAFAEAIRLQPGIKEIYLAKAEVDRFRNANDEAIAAARKATEIDPSYADAFAMLGELLANRQGKEAEAIEVLRTAIKLNPRLTEPYETLGGLYRSQNDDKAAEEILRQGMAADPKHMAGRFDLGRMMVKQKRLVEARQLWEGRTSDDDRTMPSLIVELTRAENLKHATDALAQKPNDPEALVDMGLAVMEGDHWVIDFRQKRALVYFRKALELKPNLARAQYGIVKAYIQGVDISKDEKKIIDQELAKLRKLDPTLAAEMDAYRKTYVSGLQAMP
jgi:tetratricopeptide (TPR) repeat protein